MLNFVIVKHTNYQVRRSRSQDQGSEKGEIELLRVNPRQRRPLATRLRFIMSVWSSMVQGPSRLGTAAPTPTTVVAPSQKLLGQKEAVTSCKGGTPANSMPCSARTCCNRSVIDGSTPERARTSQTGLCPRGRPRLPLRRRLTAREARGRSSSSSRALCTSGQGAGSAARGTSRPRRAPPLREPRHRG